MKSKKKQQQRDTVLEFTCGYTNHSQFCRELHNHTIKELQLEWCAINLKGI